MIDQGERVKGIVKATLKEHGLMSEDIGYNVAQQAQAPVPIQDGAEGTQMALAPAWLIMVTMRNPLLGAVAIGFSVPVAGVLPGDDVLRGVTLALLNRCREEKDRTLGDSMPLNGRERAA